MKVAEVLKALRDSIIELYIERVGFGFCQIELRHRLECAEFCTSLRSMDLLLDPRFADNVLKVLLPHIGPRLEQLTLGLNHE